MPDNRRVPENTGNHGTKKLKAPENRCFKRKTAAACTRYQKAGHMLGSLEGTVFLSCNQLVTYKKEGLSASQGPRVGILLHKTFPSLNFGNYFKNLKSCADNNETDQHGLIHNLS